MTARICAGIDPGGTTGLAVVHYDGEQYALGLHGGLTGSAEATVADLAWLGGYSFPIAVERFVVSRRAGRSATSGASEKARNIIGALSAAHRGRIRLHTAAEVKAWATNKRLDAAGLKPTTGLPHSRDAARHALFTLVKHYGCPDPLGSRYGR